MRCGEEATIFQSAIGKFLAASKVQTASGRSRPTRIGQTTSGQSPAGVDEVEKNDE